MAAPDPPTAADRRGLSLPADAGEHCPGEGQEAGGRRRRCGRQGHRGWTGCGPPAADIAAPRPSIASTRASTILVIGARDGGRDSASGGRPGDRSAALHLRESPRAPTPQRWTGAPHQAFCRRQGRPISRVQTGEADPLTCGISSSPRPPVTQSAHHAGRLAAGKLWAPAQDLLVWDRMALFCKMSNLQSEQRHAAANGTRQSSKS